MRYLALATDYDGTLATDGVVDPQTIEALQRWRSSGRKLILITGRRMDDFLKHAAIVDLFDWVVVENGAVLYDPESRTERRLGDRPPDEFVQRLSDRITQSENPLEALPSKEFNKLIRDQDLEMLAEGRVIVATWTPFDADATELIQEMNLPLQVILNKGAVMILPIGINKASGLQAALHELELSIDRVVGVGDAENDCEFLEQCGYSVAVANALPAVKEQVNWVTDGSRGAGVMELIDKIIAEDVS